MNARGARMPHGEVVWIVRHGQTASSSRGAYSGLLEIPLTPHGREQAREAARQLSGEGVDQVVTSPLSRARDTAAAIADAAGAPLRIDARLREVDYGPLEGMDRAEAAEHLGEAYLRWRERPFDATLDGAEPLPAALGRAGAAAAEALAEASRPVLVAHQGILRLVLVSLGAIRREEYFEVTIPEAAPIEVPVDEAGRMRAEHRLGPPVRRQDVRA